MQISGGWKKCKKNAQNASCIYCTHPPEITQYFWIQVGSLTLFLSNNSLFLNASPFPHPFPFNSLGASHKNATWDPEKCNEKSKQMQLNAKKKVNKCNFQQNPFVTHESQWLCMVMCKKKKSALDKAMDCIFALITVCMPTRASLVCKRGSGITDTRRAGSGNMYINMYRVSEVAF